MDSDQQAVEAALLWHVPALRRLGAGGQALAAAFDAGGQAEIWWESAPAEHDILGIAAGAVRAERRGESSAAAKRYERLDTMGRWAGLLAAYLRAWSPSSAERGPIVTAAHMTRDLDVEGPLSAWMHCRLAMCAYDRSFGDLVDSHLQAAIEAAGDLGQLRIVLLGERANVLGDRSVLSEMAGRSLSEFPYDELVQRSWIDAAALEGAQDQLAEAIVERARGPWSSTVRIGRGPLDELLAADTQATWCGALWQRRAIRRQLGATALLNGPRGGKQAAWALWMWLDAGGREIERVADLVEPQLAEEDIDALLRAWFSRIAPDDARFMGLARLANTFWDRCSDDVATWLVESILVGPTHHPVLDEGRRALNRLGRRLPTLYERHVEESDPELRTALAADLSSLEADALTPRAAELLLETLTPSADRSTHALLRRRGRVTAEPPMSWNERPSDLLLAAAIDRAAVSDAAIESALRNLVESLARFGTDARQGRFPMGSNVPRSIAKGLLLLDAEAPLARQAVDALLELAGDMAVSGEHRAEALGALAVLGAEGRLSEHDRARIRSAAVGAAADRPLAISHDRFEAIRLLALATDLDAGERAYLVALGRSSDATARHAAVNAAALARHATGDETLTWVVLSALFDPAEDVVAKAVEAIDSELISHPAYGKVAIERLAKLQADRGRRTRAAIAACLGRIRASDTDLSEDISTLVTAAQDDGSWLVRRALARSEPTQV